MPEVVLFERIVLPVLGMTLGAGTLVGVFLLLRQWIDRRHERELRGAGGGIDAGQVEELRSRIAAVEETAGRVQELEERLDFAERMLARERERPALGGGD